jgi:hypothetical protein
MAKPASRPEDFTTTVRPESAVSRASLAEAYDSPFPAAYAPLIAYAAARNLVSADIASELYRKHAAGDIDAVWRTLDRCGAMEALDAYSACVRCDHQVADRAAATCPPWCDREHGDGETARLPWVTHLRVVAGFDLPPIPPTVVPDGRAGLVGPAVVEVAQTVEGGRESAAFVGLAVPSADTLGHGSADLVLTADEARGIAAGLFRAADIVDGCPP